MSRRTLLQGGTAALLAAGIWPGTLAAGDVAGGNFPFICVNDLHYYDDKCGPFFQRMIAKMKEASPESRLLLIVGDLCEDGNREQLAAIRDILKTYDITMKVVCGNHDWLNNSDRRAFQDFYPESFNYTFEHGGWQFVGLDTTDGRNASGTSIHQPTLDWVDQNLPRLDKKRPLILFTHFPLGNLVVYRPKNADNLLNRFLDYNVRAIFNGHFHSHTERQRGDYLITTDKCCSFHRANHDFTPEKGFFACDAKDGAVTRKFVEVPMKA